MCQQQSRLRRIFLLAGVSGIVVLATCAVYGDVTTFGFIIMDDYLYVVRNPPVAAGLTRQGILWALTSTEASNWHPLTWVSHMLDVQLFGMNAGWQHLVNLMLHFANVLLLLQILRTMTGRLWRSVLVALLFAVHPLHVESVVWISERKDLLSTLFGLLALGAYLRYVRTFALGSYLAVIVLHALSLTAKPMLVTLPLLLLLLDYWPLRRGFRESSGRTAALAEKIPLLAISAAAGLITYLAQHQGASVVGNALVPLGRRLANTLLSYVAYLVGTVWPQRLAVFYPFPDSIPWWKVAVCALTLIGITVLVILGARKRPSALIGWLWYLLTLLPVIGLVQVGAQARADRYTYLPLVGIFLMVVWGAGEIAGNRFRARFAAAGACLVLVALGYRAHQQAGYWSDSVTLLRHALEVTPPNAISENNLGYALDEAGNLEEAIAHYRAAVHLNSDYDLAHNNLGAALGRLGMEAAAIDHFRAALRVNPAYAEAHNNLGYALVRTGRIEEGIVHLRSALARQPGNLTARKNLEEALKMLRLELP